MSDGPAHVVFALLTLVPGRVGGSEAVVRGLLERFAEGDGPQRVTVLAPRAVAEAYRDVAHGPVVMKEVRHRPGDGTATRALGMLRAALRPGRLARELPDDVDVVHYPLTVQIPRADRAARVVTINDLQHLELPENFSALERAYRARAYEGGARAATLVICPSEHTRDALVARAGIARDRIEVVPLGIDHARFRPEADDDPLAGFVLPERFIVYPANLWPHKNHERLLEGLARVPERELGLVLTGESYGRADALLHSAAKLGVRHRVRHLGHLPAEAMPSLYRRALAIVFPSLFEGFGSPPLEAMACGCPAAVSTAGSLPEVCGEAALTFDPNDTTAIADAITRITRDDELRDELRTAGLARAAQFTWSAAAARHAECYSRAARMLDDG